VTQAVSKEARRHRRGRRLAALPFVLPALVTVGLTLLFPIGYNIWLSFHRYNLAQPYLGQSFLGLDNYLDAIRGEFFWNALKNSLLVTFGALMIELPVGYALALALNRRLRGHRFFQLVFLLPLLLVPAVAAFMWRFIFQFDGIANYTLTSFGLDPVNWTSTTTGMITIIIVVTWQNTPFAMIVLLAGLQSVDPSLIDAAQVDGANALQRFRHVVFPLMKPFLLIVVSIRTMDLLRVFDEGYVLTGGGPGRTTELLSQLVYTQSFTYFDLGAGSALSIIQTILIVGFLVFYFAILSPREEHRHART
jgi:multiple sugar transport system permease protein